jgi:hypothetical protein
MFLCTAQMVGICGICIRTKLLLFERPNLGGWVGHTAHIAEMRNAYKILF